MDWLRIVMFYLRSTKLIKVLEFFSSLGFFSLSEIIGGRAADMLYNKMIPPEPEMTNVFNAVINDCVVIDVGASVGYYTKMAAESAKLVLAVEPHPQRFKELCRICSNRRNVVPVRKFISDREGVIDVFEERYKRIWLPYTPTRDGISRTYTCFHLHDKAAKPVRLHCTTLNNLASHFKIQRVGVIKIDVEGSEFEVLLGADQVLRSTNHVLLEFHYPENDRRYIQCHCLLNELGFKSRRLSADGTYVHFYRTPGLKTNA